MLIQDAQIRFKVALDKLDTSVYPELTPEVIDVIFRINEEHFIKTRYSGNNYKREGFEVSQKRIDDLRTLVKNVTIVANETGDNLSQYTFNLTSVPDYWFYLKSQVGLKVKVCGLQYGSSTVNSSNTTDLYKDSEIIVRQLDDIRKLKQDPFNKSIRDEISITFEAEGNITVHTDKTFTVKEFYLTYLKAPLLIENTAIGVNNPVGYTNTFNTPIETHQEIIDMAVNWTLENIESVRYNTNSAELLKSE